MLAIAGDTAAMLAVLPDQSRGKPRHPPCLDQAGDTPAPRPGRAIHRSDQEEFYQILFYKDEVDLETRLDEWEQFHNFHRHPTAHLLLEFAARYETMGLLQDDTFNCRSARRIYPTR